MPINFEGTFSVLIPLPQIGHSNKKFIQESINPEDLLEDKDINNGKNTEYDPHITVHMGLTNDIEKVKKICRETNPFSFTISNFGYFSTPKQESFNHEWDVLWRHVDDKKKLIALHSDLVGAFDRKWHFNEYNPHVTVAYLKYGMAKYYTEPKLKQKSDYWTVHVDHVIYKKFNDKTVDPIKIYLGLDQKLH